jgi:hypothetical protein
MGAVVGRRVFDALGTRLFVGNELVRDAFNTPGSEYISLGSLHHLRD